jgi:hypothetical protein
MKGQEDFFGKLGMEPDRDEPIIDNDNLTESITPEPIEEATPFFSEHFKNMGEKTDKKKTGAEERFEKMRDSRPDIYG